MTDIASIASSAGAQGAYRAAQSVSGAGSLGSEGFGPESFGEVLRGAAGNAIGTVRASEGIAAAGLRGEIDTQRVVEATLELETTLRVAVGMRDKFVQAYQDVLRMQI